MVAFPSGQLMDDAVRLVEVGLRLAPEHVPIQDQPMEVVTAANLVLKHKQRHVTRKPVLVSNYLLQHCLIY